MAQLFIGRKQEQKQFRQVLRQFQRPWAAKHLPTVMGLMGKSFPLPEKPTIFLFYGEGGMGKTSLVKALQGIADQEPFAENQTARNQFQTLYLDWEQHKTDPEIAVGHDQLQPEAVLEVLHHMVTQPLGEIEAYTELAQKIKGLEQKVDAQRKRPPEAGQAALKQEVLDLGAKGLAWVVRTAATAQTGPVAAAAGGPVVERLAKAGIQLSAEGLSQVNRLVSKALTPEERALYGSAQEKLATALGQGIAAAAQKRPLVVILDTYEIVDQMLCDYALRQVIRASSGNTVWVLAGRANLADSGQRGQQYFRGYRQDFSEQVYPTRLREFGHEELKTFFDQKVPDRPLSDDQVETLAQFSRGIPFVINLAAELWDTGVPFEDIVAPPEDPGTGSIHYKIIRAMSERFLMHCLGEEHRADRQAVFAFVLMRRPSASLLRSMLDVADLEPRLQELRQRYSFILRDELQLDNKLRFFLKAHLLASVNRSEAILQEMNRRALTWLELQLEQAAQGLTDHADWLADENCAELLLDYVHHCFWQDDGLQNQAGWRSLVPWFVKGWQYSPRWTRQLLEVVDDFSAQFSAAEQGRLKLLKEGAGRQAEVEAEAALLEELDQLAEWGWLSRADEAEHRAILGLKRGWLLYRQEQYEKAFATYEKTQCELPSDAQTLASNLSSALDNLGFQVGWERGTSIASELARRAFELATELDPNNKFAWYGLGAIQAKFKVYDKAITAYSKAIELDPKYAYPHNGLGNVYDSQEEYDKAIAAYSKAIELDPKYAYPHNGLGNVYNSQEGYDKAIIAYSKAIELDPRYASPHNGLGAIYGSQGEYDKAIAACQKAIELDPKLASPHNNLGNAYDSQGEYDKAIAAYNKAIELDPKLASPHNNLGIFYKARGEYDKAIAAYNKAIELDPKLASPHNGSGNVYHSQGEYGKAIAAYNKAIELDPKLASPHNGSGNVYHSQGEYGKAIAAYNKAIELDPKLASPHNGLGWLHLTQNRLDEAEKYFERAITIDGKDAIYQSNLGIVFALRNDLVHARTIWQQTIPLYARNNDWNNAMISLYRIALGERESGLAGLQTLIAQDALPTVMSGALDDAKVLLKCPTPIPGILEAVDLLENYLEQNS